MEKTKLGLTENVEAALSYVLGPITGIVFLILERDNKFVGFHALQSIVYFGILWVAITVLSFIPFIGTIIASILDLLYFVSYVYLIFSAYKGRTFKIPVIGDAAWAQINK